MNATEIRSSINEIAKAMVLKGLREPSARFDIENDKASFEVILRWKDVTKADGSYSTGEYKWLKGNTPRAALDDASEFVAGLPSAEEARMTQFMGALANVIDLGKSNGIEVEFLNPLQATMKKLSDNILTDQRAA